MCISWTHTLITAQHCPACAWFRTARLPSFLCALLLRVSVCFKRMQYIICCNIGSDMLCGKTTFMNCPSILQGVLHNAA